MRAGALRDHVVIERQAKIGVDDLNADIFQWVPHLRAWVEIIWNAGDEAYSTQTRQRYEVQSMTVRMRWHPDIRVTDRLLHEGAAYDIKAIRPSGKRREEALELKCELAP